LLKGGESEGAGGKVLWVAGLLFALFLALVSPLASAYPDGLERVAEDHGFLSQAQNPLYNIIPDYMFPGISNEALATIAAGVIGTLIVFGIAMLVGYSRNKKQSL
jgi:ABC-type Fe3+ transport system permease subunit